MTTVGTFFYLNCVICWQDFFGTTPLFCCHTIAPYRKQQWRGCTYTSFCLDYVISVRVSNQLCESHSGLTLPPAAWLVLEKLQELSLFCFVFVKIFLVFPYSIFQNGRPYSVWSHPNSTKYCSQVSGGTKSNSTGFLKSFYSSKLSCLTDDSTEQI